MHNGHGHGHGHGPGHGNGNGKRWLLIGLLVLGGFWLLNDAYGDGYRDALVQTNQAGNARFYRGGPDFPWGLLILGGIGYIAWRKGAFDRFGGPPQGIGAPGVPRYDGGPGFGGGFRGPRGVFEEWHRESHAAAQARAAAPTSAPAQIATAAPAPENGHEQSTYTNAPQAETPPPPPPAPEYWAAMNPPAESAPAAPTDAAPTSTVGTSGATGPTLERW